MSISPSPERVKPVSAAPAAQPPTPTWTPDFAKDPPWKWAWYRVAPGESMTFLWVCLIHAMTIIGLIAFPLPGWGIAAAAYGLFWLGGMGTTVCYHRALAHRALKLNPVVEFVLIALAIFNGSGTPATWTANHRLHHAKSDTPEDISSPRVGGFWWSHLRWLWQTPQTPVAKWAPDLSTKYYRFFTRWQIPILAVSLLVWLPLGPAAFFWLGAIRLTFALHSQCFVNSVAHMKKTVRPDEDSSQNMAWLAPVQALQGENWHGNHHAQPASARLGWTWAQLDLGWWTIIALEKLGLARDVRRPKAVNPGA